MAPDVASPTQPRESRAPIRVVVADDSSAIRTLARHVLSPQRGFDIAEAADGFEALAAVDSFRPHCVVLDIQMPRMDGYQALAEVRRRVPDLPVIMLSGQSEAEAGAEARRCGASSYVDKSRSLADLAEAVRLVTTAPAPTVPSPSTDTEPTPEVTVPVTQSPVQPDSDVTRELRRLEYVVSHDLGEPLRIMKGFSGLLLSRYAEALDPTATTYVTHIADAAERMQSMLDDLLAYSRAGRAQPVLSRVQLSSVLERTLETLHDDIEKRNAEVTAGLLPVVVGDAVMLETVLGHLVTNAITFNREDRPIVQIAGSSDGEATLTVTDNGIGIPAADRERVFDLFVRLNAREQYPGTGTGLAVCRRLLSLQGGTITLDSGSDGGTVVVLTLPAASDEPSPNRERSDGTDRP